MTNADFEPTTSLDGTHGIARWDVSRARTSLFVLLVGIAGGLVACGDQAATVTDTGDVAVIEETDSDTTPESVSSTPESPILDPLTGMPMIDDVRVSPERKATLSAWMATQMAGGAEGLGDFEALMTDMESEPPVPAGGAGISPEAGSLGDEPSMLGDYDIPVETPYDAQALEAAIGLFKTQVGLDDADMQNVGLYVITPFEFASMRDSTMKPVGRGSTGSSADAQIWIAVFDTSEPLTAGTFLPENIEELGDLGPESLLAGPDGLTTIYYILARSSDLSGGSFLALGKGVLNDQTSWTRADLEAIDLD